MFVNPVLLPIGGNAKTLNNGGAAEQIFDLYTVGGTILLASISCRVTTVLANNLTAAFFDFWDGTTSIPLTLNTGVISSMPVGSWFGKVSIAANPMLVNNAGAGCVAEHATDMSATKQQIITAKNGVVSKIRFRYTSAGASSGVLIPHAIWAPLHDGAVITPA